MFPIPINPDQIAVSPFHRLTHRPTDSIIDRRTKDKREIDGRPDTNSGNKGSAQNKYAAISTRRGTLWAEFWAAATVHRNRNAVVSEFNIALPDIPPNYAPSDDEAPLFCVPCVVCCHLEDRRLLVLMCGTAVFANYEKPIISEFPVGKWLNY